MTAVSPFRVWSPSGKPDLDFVPELSNVQASSALAAQARGLTFLQPGPNGERLACASLWRVPVTAVGSRKLETWLRGHAPAASVLNIFGATHYLGCGHSGLDQILGIQTDGYSDRSTITQREAFHVWSGEMRVEPLCVQMNVTSKLGFEINTQKKRDTGRLPDDAVSLLKKIAVTRSIVPYDYDPAEEHLFTLPGGHDPRHSSLQGDAGIIACSHSPERPDIRLQEKGWWQNLINYFVGAHVVMKDDPHLYGNDLTSCVTRLQTNLILFRNLAQGTAVTKIAKTEPLTAKLAQIYADLLLWCDYQSTQVQESRSQNDVEFTSPAEPPSPHKMFDLVLVPETRFASLWRRWVG